MVVSCNHVLGTQVHEGDDVRPPDLLNVARVTGGDVMGDCDAGHQCQYEQQ